MDISSKNSIAIKLEIPIDIFLNELFLISVNIPNIQYHVDAKACVNTS